jgi:hypothetical protein
MVNSKPILIGNRTGIKEKPEKILERFTDLARSYDLATLNAGIYYIAPKIGMHNMYWIVNLESSIRFEVILNHGVSPFWSTLDAKTRPGIIAPILKWSSIG